LAGKGIAAQLISRCIEHAERWDALRSLEVACGNAPAIGLYEKCGFVVTDTGDSSIMNLFFDTGEKYAK
jgi:ribosomal protein S18 acetylase RimI-like enzyme